MSLDPKGIAGLAKPQLQLIPPELPSDVLCSLRPLCKGMRRLNDGMGRWLTGLRRLICWMGKKQEEGFQNPEAKPGPKTEGERALWQAMGWCEEDDEW